MRPGEITRFNLDTAHPAPARGLAGEVFRAIAGLFLWAMGWKLRGDWPGQAKAVLLAAPHSSNLDGFLMLAAAARYRVKLRWMGKKTLVSGPFGGFVRWLGCVPVDRSAANGMVEGMAVAFADDGDLILAVAPEGTRTRAETWKKGYWMIARRAGVPIIFSVLDYSRKTVFVPAMIKPSDDYDADWAAIRPFYAQAGARFPERFCLPE